MAYLCVDRESEYIADNKPTRNFFEWTGWTNTDGETCNIISVPKGTIKKLIGREISWEDEPIHLESFLYMNGEL
jgi:hypothetical protein